MKSRSTQPPKKMTPPRQVQPKSPPEHKIPNSNIPNSNTSSTKPQKHKKRIKKTPKHTKVTSDKPHKTPKRKGKKKKTKHNKEQPNPPSSTKVNKLSQRMTKMLDTDLCSKMLSETIDMTKKTKNTNGKFQCPVCHTHMCVDKKDRSKKFNCVFCQQTLVYGKSEDQYFTITSDVEDGSPPPPPVTELRKGDRVKIVQGEDDVVGWLYQDPILITRKRSRLPRQKKNNKVYHVYFGLGSDPMTKTFGDKRGRPFTIVRQPGYNLHEYQQRHGHFEIVGLTFTKAQDKRYVKEVNSDLIDNQVAVVKNKIQVTYRSIRTMKDGEWLDDRVIDFYSMLVWKKTLHDNTKILLFNSRFYQKMTVPEKKKRSTTAVKSIYYNQVHRWMKNTDWFSSDLFLFPIHRSGDHWGLVVITRTDKTFTVTYMDPLKYEGKTYGLKFRECIRSYLLDKVSIKQFRQYTVRISQDCQVCSSQENGHDCGVFVCSYIYCLCHGMSLDTFKQKDMVQYRKHICLSVLGGRLLPMIKHHNVLVDV